MCLKKNKTQKIGYFSRPQSIFFIFGLNDLFICILKHFGSFFPVTDISGQKCLGEVFIAYEVRQWQNPAFFSESIPKVTINPRQASSSHHQIINKKQILRQQCRLINPAPKVAFNAFACQRKGSHESKNWKAWLGRPPDIKKQKN